MDKKTVKVKVERLDSAERISQLEKIDKLREYGVGEEINLPQVRFLLRHPSLRDSSCTDVGITSLLSLVINHLGRVVYLKVSLDCRSLSPASSARVSQLRLSSGDRQLRRSPLLCPSYQLQIPMTQRGRNSETFPVP